MQNFLAETRKRISEEGLATDDIIFIGSEDTGHQCTWDEFCDLADFKYQDEFSVLVIAEDLVIAFKGGEKLWRRNQGRCEWWEVSRPFLRPEGNLPIRRLRGGGSWPTLETQNGHTNT